MRARIKRSVSALAVSAAVAVAIDCAIAYWWMVCGPFPESAWPS